MRSHRKGLLTGCFHLLFQIRQNGKTLVDGLVELIFFLIRTLKIILFLLLQLRISVLG